MCNKNNNETNNNCHNLFIIALLSIANPSHQGYHTGSHYKSWKCEGAGDSKVGAVTGAVEDSIHYRYHCNTIVCVCQLRRTETLRIFLDFLCSLLCRGGVTDVAGFNSQLGEEILAFCTFLPQNLFTMAKSIVHRLLSMQLYSPQIYYHNQQIPTLPIHW